jgi:hypothetical protein
MVRGWFVSFPEQQKEGRRALHITIGDVERCETITTILSNVHIASADGNSFSDQYESPGK